MKFVAKSNFKRINYDAHDFTPKHVIQFKKEESYNSTNENLSFIIINNCIFYKNITMNYVYEFFYTEKELRLQKLKKINENRY